MAYDAITIDSSVFIKLGLNLESGLLAQLTQFKAGPTDFILSEVVERELFKHLRQNGKTARDAALGALAKVEALFLAEEANLAQIVAAKAAIDDPGEVAKKRLARFTANTGANIIAASLCTMDDLLKYHFTPLAPFTAAGAKKSEYPDAIALISLEKWAAGKGSRILAVSADKGWAEFAEKSEQVDVEEDLATALEIVQEHAEAAEQAIAHFITSIEGGALPDAAARIESLLEDNLAEWIFHPEGQGSFYLEGDSAGIDLGGFEYEKTGDDFDITIVRAGHEWTVARIGFSAAGTAKADFSLSIWDSIDKEYVGMGGQSVEREVDFEGAFLLTLSGDLSGPLADVEIEELELVDAPGTIDFGEIEYDPGYDDDYEDVAVMAVQEVDVDAQADDEAAGATAAGTLPF